jgi:hypothetical protein
LHTQEIQVTFDVKHGDTPEWSAVIVEPRKKAVQAPSPTVDRTSCESQLDAQVLPIEFDPIVEGIVPFFCFD